MKSILEAEKIEDINIYEPIFKNEDFKAPSVKSISEIEQEIIQYFSQKYNDVIFKPDEINNPNPIILDGSMPFNMVVRVEGAYLGFIEPEDYNDYFNEPDILYHGSCKSFIGNNMLGIADTSYETGPIFGYTDLEYLTMLHMIYGHGNCEFSISSTNYATQYRTPDNMKNQTRKRHNEVVSDRIVYNEEIGELEKEKPAYVVWIKENKEEKRERNKKWKMTKKASEQLGIPIVIIDKESILEKEEQKIENFKEIFAGRKENLQNLSDEQLLRKIIVEFENNCVGNHSTNKKYKENKYFSNENRINLIHFIEEELVRMEEEEPERYFTCLKDLMEIMNEEFFKHGEQATFYYEKARGIEEKIKNHNDNIKLKDSILIDSQDILRSKRTAELENVAVEIVKLHENQATIESTITIENSPNDVEGR